MNKQARKAAWVVLALGLALTIWYQTLDEGHKYYVNNLARQVRHLPDRYSV